MTLASPGWCGGLVCSGEVLGECGEVGVGARIDIMWPLGDPPRNVVLVPRPSQIVDEVSYRVPECGPGCDPVCCPSQRHRMPSLRGQEVLQLGTVVILKVCEDPLGRGTHADQSALSGRAVAVEVARIDPVFPDLEIRNENLRIVGCQRLVRFAVA
jgi:hypothetical protein